MSETETPAPLATLSVAETNLFNVVACRYVVSMIPAGNETANSADVVPATDPDFRRVQQTGRRHAGLLEQFTAHLTELPKTNRSGFFRLI